MSAPDPRAAAADTPPVTPGAARLSIDDVLTVRDRSMRRLPRLLRGALSLTWSAARKEFAASAALQLAAAACMAAQILIVQRALSGVIGVAEGKEDISDVLPAILALAAVSTVLTFANIARTELQRLLGELVARRALDQVLDVSTGVELLAYDSPTFLDRLQRARTNAVSRPAQMATGLVGVLSALLTIAGVSAALFFLEPVFLVVVLLAYVPLWIATTRASKVIYRFNVVQTERDRRRDYLSYVLTRKEEAAEVRAFDLSGFFRRQYEKLWDERLAELRTVVARRMRVGLIGGMVTSALTAATLAVLVVFINGERMDLAQAGAAAAAVVLLGQRLQLLSGSAGSLYESSLFIEDFTSFVAAMPVLDAARPKDQAPDGFRKLRVDSVSFSYPTRDEAALDNVTLEVEQGQVVALVGENGSGKTTLAKLLAGLYQPSLGAITWDGIDVTKCDPLSVRRSVGVIFQDFAKYMLTAHDNIATGRHERFDLRDEVVRAARRSGADSFISRLPKGYDGRLGSPFLGGNDLSVGQWQRMALARAFFRDAPFLILDEPTAALDPRSEADLFENVRELYGGRTVLLISHRFSTVRSADMIFVLFAGRIVERGTHEQLMDIAGLYAELFTLQAAGFLDPQQ
ncbi:MAG: ABC transporter ATP-binding protein [Actinomycetota bacterium]